jgi:Peptidase family M1 domain
VFGVLRDIRGDDPASVFQDYRVSGGRKGGKQTGNPEGDGAAHTLILAAAFVEFRWRLLALALSGTVGFMPRFARYSPVGVCLLAAVWTAASSGGVRSGIALGHGERFAAEAAPREPKALYQALNALRVDPNQVYEVKSLSLRRDVINLTFDEGKLAFFQPLDGHVTGVVFAGRGHAIAIPHDRGERRSLAQFVGVPIMDQTFSSAYLRFDDGAAAEIARELAKAGNGPTRDREFAAQWEAVLASTNSWHSLRILEDMLSTAPLPYFYAGILSDEHGLVDLVLDSRRYEQVLFGQARASEGVTLYDVWASFRAADTSLTSSETFLPVDYRIDTRIAQDLSLTGTTTMRLKAVRGGDRVVALELSRKLAIEDVKAENGSPLVYFQNEDLSKREILSRGNNSVLVVLPAPVSEGEGFQLELSYHGTVISDAGNGVEFVGEHETWYAHPAGIDHFAPFDLSFRWPKRFSLVATGRKMETREEGEFENGQWVSDVPFALAGFNLSEYQVETTGSGHPEIELYANRQLENAILARLQREDVGVPFRPGPPRPAPFAGHVDDAPLPPPNPAAVLKNLGGEILDAIHFYEKLNGPFPFSDLKISQIPGSMGQGWPGLVYLSTLAFLPPEAEQRAGVAERTQELAREVMPFHEVAHQWWGNVAVSATYRDVWIQEGMANYLALLYADSRKPNAHRLTAWLERYRSELAAKVPGTGGSVEEAGPLTLGYRLGSSRTPNAYNTVIYGKGTWVMHMIHEMLRNSDADDPDARFRELLTSILTQYRFKPFSTEDFQRALEQQMTPSMDVEGNHSMNWFFSQWVKATGIPVYRVQFEAKPRGREFVVAGKLEQTEVDDVFTAPVPIYASRVGQKPQRLGVVITMGPETRFRFFSRFRPSHLAIDPHLTLLCLTD